MWFGAAAAHRGEAWTDDVIDYERVYPLLDVERNRSLDYLQSALQVNE